MKYRVIYTLAVFVFLTACGGGSGPRTSSPSAAVDGNIDLDVQNNATDVISNISNNTSDQQSIDIPESSDRDESVSTTTNTKPDAVDTKDETDTEVDPVDGENVTTESTDNNELVVSIDTTAVDTDTIDTSETIDTNPVDETIDSLRDLNPVVETIESIPVINPVNEVLESFPGTLENEDRTRPSAGSFSSSSKELKSNGADLFSNTGPQTVDAFRVVSWPGLRYGNFLVSNNPFNASLASYPEWNQQISLHLTPQDQNGTDRYSVMFDWDWGAEADTFGSIFSIKSYPEVIYGTKSAFERSGTFAETGLPVELYDAPSFDIDYSYEYEADRSQSTSSGGTDSEFNVAITSSFHSSCDIQRTGDKSTDNLVFEATVWLKTGNRKPSVDAPHEFITTSDGKQFDVYTKVAENSNFIAFVARNEQLTGNIQYSELMQYASDNANQYGIYQLQSTDCMANILIGTEIWHGAGMFSLKEYQINRHY